MGRSRSAHSVDRLSRRERPEFEIDNAAARFQWFMASRRDREGVPLSGIYAEGLRARAKFQRIEPGAEPPIAPGGPGSLNWTPIGPSVVASGSPVSGRITAIVAGPGGNRAYVGAANGGVWFTGDGGAAWAPLDDYVISPAGTSLVEADALSVGAIAVRFGVTAATDELYIGTGEANQNFDAYFGIGVRHSSAGGAPGTWSLEATNLAGTSISDLTMDPDNPSVVLAGTGRGIFRRPTAGSPATWTQVTSPAFTNPGNAISELIAAGSGASKRYYAAFRGDKVYSSPDGTTWTALTGIAAPGRIALGAGESDATAVYAFNQDGTVYRLVGTTFQSVAGTPPVGALFPTLQGWYDLVVRVDPTNGNTIYLLGQTGYFKGTLSGGPGTYTFGFNAANATHPWTDPTWIADGIHPDGHALAFGLNALGTAHDPTNVWMGTDGGVWRSTASGVNGTFGSRNTGLAITQLTYLAQRADTDAVVFAGSQDNGTERFLGEEAWVEVDGGDGGGVAVDPNNPYNVLHQYVRAGQWFDDPNQPAGNLALFSAGLYVSTSGGGPGLFSPVAFPPITVMTTAQKTAANTESNATGFYAPFSTTPPGVAPTLAAFGTNRLWLTTDWGTTWVTLPTGTNPYAGAPNAAQDVIDGGSIVAIAFASATRAFAATSNAIWQYDKMGAVWNRTVIPNAGLPLFHPFTAVSVEDAAAGTFYATLGGGGMAHLYYWNGAAWSVAMPTTVVDVPTHAVAVDPSNPNTIYVGTDVGVWKGTKTGPTSWAWTIFSAGLPESAVVGLAVHDRARLLRAATHGRSAWEIQLSGTPSDPDVYMRVNYGDSGRIIGGARNPWVEGLLDPTKPGFPIYHWFSADIKVRRGSLTPLPPLGSPPDYYDYAVDIGDYVDSTTDTETADSSGSDTIFVEIHNRSLVSPVPSAQVKVLLLLADASAVLPPLPANYAGHINAFDANPAWLAGSSWRFADPVQPYRTPPRDLDVRTPQVVEYSVDFSSLVLPMGHDHVCAAAFVTAPSDPITATVSDLNQATMLDKHIVHRNLHLVPSGARPITQGGGYMQDPQILLIDFWNAGRRSIATDFVFDRRGFPGRLAVLLPDLPELRNPSTFLRGFKPASIRELPPTSREELEDWFARVDEVNGSLRAEITSEHDAWADSDNWPLSRDDVRRLRKIATLDRSRVYVAASSSMPTLTGITIEPGHAISAALIIEAPADAKPGDRFRFDVLQARGERILGGSTYFVAVMRPAQHWSLSPLIKRPGRSRRSPSPRPKARKRGKS